MRRTRKQAEADNANYTNEIAELQKRIDATRILLSNAVLNCQDATAARGVSNKMNYFSYALSYFETFKEKINSKRYASIERIISDIEDIKDKLDHCAAYGGRRRICRPGSAGYIERSEALGWFINI